ncbi:DEAD/DEAH box helicase [Hirsutella rhossiliensis]|uniref:ATP-dependent RNA helicase n=1 Tax=Hirsutella rhossiliensis TaxID=111463 RepID=A0A9P8MWJ1_9HYPO|nr:DEAD/DEAH box helicase domain-containing protein [Hirsutella rhossiliensis]KAH0961694.1 DEAD/DEAH box helicase domain-containing protein [Hirsutella rhossiliensis]
MSDKPQGRRSDRRRGGGQRRHRGPKNPNEASPPSRGFDTPPHEARARPPADSRPPRTEAVPLDTPRFAELAGQNLVHPMIVSTITDDLKFDHMMPVQAATLWELLPPNRIDCLVQAKTGTGKTLAFLLPALQTIISQNRGRDAGISLLVISPTRELAMQIAQEATNLLQRLPRYRVRIAIGGTNKDKEEKQILGGCDVLIATPGRLIDHMSNPNILYAFRHLETLVLDEADRLLDMGFMPALRDIVRHLPDRNHVNRQSMLFSATIAPHVNQVAGLVLSLGYKFISTIPAGEVNTHERVPQFLVTVPTFSSLAPAMVGSIREEAARHQDFKAIVFAPTAAQAGLYGHILSMLPSLPPVSTLHSRISQTKRTKVTNDYREAKAAILVATDVVARGMDFPGVTTVFQVGIPSDEQSYIHRLGRTARADAEGRGIFIVCEAEAWFPKWTLKKITLVPHNADLSSAADVYSVVEAMDEDDQANIYKAWLGYYKNHLKALKWDKEELVSQGNVFARDGLGTPDIPPIAKSTVGKMGLRGTKGLNTVPDRPKPGRTQGGGGRVRHGGGQE